MAEGKGLLKEETDNTFLHNVPLSLGKMVPLTPHPHPDSTLLTDTPDAGARANPVSKDTSRITMLEVDFFPLYLGEKIKSDPLGKSTKKRVSASFPFPLPPAPVCSALIQAAQPGLGLRQSLLPLTGCRGWLGLAALL